MNFEELDLLSIEDINKLYNELVLNNDSDLISTASIIHNLYCSRTRKYITSHVEYWSGSAETCENRPDVWTPGSTGCDTSYCRAVCADGSYCGQYYVVGCYTIR